MFLYHVSPKYNRDSITIQGLKGASITSVWSTNRKRNWRTQQIGVLQPQGNYGFEFIEPATTYGYTLFLNRFIDREEDVDIWQLDVSGLEVFYDPEQHLSDPLSMKLLKDDLSAEEIEECEQGRCDHEKADRRWYTPSYVGPERLVLLSEQEISIIRKTEQVQDICELRERVKPFPIWGIGF